MSEEYGPNKNLLVRGYKTINSDVRNPIIIVCIFVCNKSKIDNIPRVIKSTHASLRLKSPFAKGLSLVRSTILSNL
jgi:hypothetical protein